MPVKRKINVGVVILNFNNAKKTITCLDSIMRSDVFVASIVVVDNYSQIEDWETLRGELINFFKLCKDYHIALYSIRCFENMGYAAGNNTGIDLILKDTECDYVYILNNDTVLYEDSLRLLYDFSVKNSFDMCGTRLIYPNGKIQANGSAAYYRWLGLAFPNRSNNIANERISCIIGASVLVSREFLLSVGKMSQEYFLFFEEIDWAIQARQKNFKLGYCWESVVIHDEGSSTGSKKKSLISVYYGSRNRILVTKKFFLYALPTVMLFNLFSIVKSILAFDFIDARIKIIATLAGCFNEFGISKNHEKLLRNSNEKKNCN